MEPFYVHILGCGCALPTAKHNPSSQVVEIRGKMFMVDCGEGTQLQLRRSHIRFTNISAVFISHMHGDHCFGLLGMISTFGLLGRTRSLHLYAPSGMEKILKTELDAYCNGYDYEVIFHGVDTKTQNVIYEDRSLTVETIPLEHRVPCCGYLFREKPTLPHIRRDMIDFYGIPISQIDNIKNGAGYTTEDGRVIDNSRLVLPADPPRSYAYCSDTKYIPSLHERLKDVNLLYHESTYMHEDLAKAEKYCHTTAHQAAQVAHDANAKRLLLGHFSSRYSDENLLLKEALDVFPNTQLANEGDSIEVI